MPWWRQPQSHPLCSSGPCVKLALPYHCISNCCKSPQSAKQLKYSWFLEYWFPIPGRLTELRRSTTLDSCYTLRRLLCRERLLWVQDWFCSRRELSEVHLEWKKRKSISISVKSSKSFPINPWSMNTYEINSFLGSTKNSQNNLLSVMAIIMGVKVIHFCCFCFTLTFWQPG